MENVSPINQCCINNIVKINSIESHRLHDEALLFNLLKGNFASLYKLLVIWLIVLSIILHNLNLFDKSLINED